MDNWGLTLNEKKAVMSKIQGASDFSIFAGCDFVIEAIRYDDNTGERRVAQRKLVFKQLEDVLSEKAIIASNVSTVVVTELASELEHQERCIGLHFLSNIPDSNIIEVVRGLNTSDQTYEKICQFAKVINHEYVPVVESSGVIPC